MNYENNREALVDALKEAVKEHGAPNRFKCSELAREHQAPGPMICGTIGKRYCAELSKAMGREISYAKGWFVVA